MAKIRTSHNPLLHGVSGSIGKTLVIRQTRHGIVLANRPSKPRRTHETQRRTRDKFTDAVNYANLQMRHWEARSMYQAAVNKKLTSAYQVALTDYLRSPIVHSICTNGYNGASRHEIGVFASDDFKVASVDLIIRDDTQQIVEQGAATRLRCLRNQWVYVTTNDLAATSGFTIEARARDIPGNVGSKTLPCNSSCLREPLRSIQPTTSDHEKQNTEKQASEEN
ncbi:MAG: hypothetical protein QM762_25090 [Chryseolinea sp.]